MPTHYDVYRDQLSPYQFGQALWEPRPARGLAVAVGDVGYIFLGGFRRLFNIHLPHDDASHTMGVPEYFEQLPLRDGEVFERPMVAGVYRSRSVRSVEVGTQVSGTASLVGGQFSFSTSKEQGAVLALPNTGRRCDVYIRAAYEDYINAHCDQWLAFAERHRLGIRIDDIILITGCDLTTSWAMAAFMSSEFDASISLQFDAGMAGTVAAYSGISWRNSRNAVYNHGPDARSRPASGDNLRLPPTTVDTSQIDMAPVPDQCVFVRGYHMKRRPLFMPKKLKAFAKPRDYSRHNEDEDEIELGDDGSGSSEDEVVELGAGEKHTPLYGPLLDYILEDPMVDLAIVHDDDLNPFLSGSVEQFVP
ncbi:hypothetical protein BV25DRAFT_1863983 [Artomyces pyxidatus]|uniref:Uncharacterized protein n=1 Tax=Artomyces pyxidatus TaxID=48021 RepID=A0ACB8SK96_9AGAM|nr:hypothetical protein BV25DRAFT_1863983 [Artomyces pyxidatus]